MRAWGRFWCSDLDRKTIDSERRFSRLVAAGTRGFTAACESDTKAALAMLDAWSPYDDYLIACEGPLHSRIVHPNVAVTFDQTARGMERFQDAVAGGMNAVLRVGDVRQAANAYISALAERNESGLPIFAIRAVFSFEYLSDSEMAAFQDAFATSESFACMRRRGARIPRLVCSSPYTTLAMIAKRCDDIK